MRADQIRNLSVVIPLLEYRLAPGESPKRAEHDPAVARQPRDFDQQFFSLAARYSLHIVVNSL